MKQPGMFYKCDLNGYAYDDDNDTNDSDDDYNIHNNDPVGQIIATI